MKSGSTVTGSRTQRERPHKKQKANEGENIFSKLGESLIGRILSFLPTKDAVRTSVLSKRWINRWTFITKLDIDDSVFYSSKRKTGGEQYFINFVYRTLLLIKASSVESFSLVIANNYDVFLLNTWISNILNRRVKNLRIGSNFELVLEMCCCAIKVPPIYVRFGYLKLLKLCGIIFTMEFPRYYRSLILPVLQKFETKNCTWLGAKSVIIEAPLLKSVFIEQDLMYSVSHEPRSCAIRFSALHLKEFTYSGCGISQPIILSTPSSAHNASANIILYQCENSVPETGSRAFLLLKQFSQGKCIKFDGSEVLTQPKVADLPEFTMLSNLELGLVTAEVLLGLLQKSPFLNTIVFKGISKFDTELLNSAVVPDCLPYLCKS